MKIYLLLLAFISASPFILNAQYASIEKIECNSILLNYQQKNASVENLVLLEKSIQPNVWVNARRKILTDLSSERTSPHHFNNLENGIYRVTVVDNGFKVITNSVIINCKNEFTINDTNNSAFDVYPNPVSTSLNIRLNEVFEAPLQYSIFSVDGRKITNGQLTNKARIDLSELSSGLYLIKLYDREKIIGIKKFIIENNQTVK